MGLTDSKPEPVGVVGTGNLGSALVSRFVGAGYEVIAHDVVVDAMAQLPSRVKRASSAEEVATLAPTIVTCVAGPIEVRECILGQHGVLSGASPGTLVIDMTTSSPEVTRNIGQVFENAEMTIVDAPVSRGVTAAVTGTLSVWIGGQEAAVTRAMPYLEPLASDILHVGPLGSGHAVKAVNMMLMAVNLIAVAEATTVGESYGIDPKSLMSVLNSSSGGNYMTCNHFPKFVQTGTYDSKFSARHMRKDLRVARALAEDVGVPALFGARALEIYDLFFAQEAERGDPDNMRLVPFLHQLLGQSSRMGIAQ